MPYIAVKYAAVSNVTLTSPGQIDGQTLNNNDLVVLPNQTDTKQNGVYFYNSGNGHLERPTNAQDQYKATNVLDNATIVWAQLGNTLAGTVWGPPKALIIKIDDASQGAHTLKAVALPPATARVATTANVTLSNPGTSTFDGVTLSTGDIVLVKDQTTGADNGLYYFNGSGSAMTRTDEPLTPTRRVHVSEGSTNAHTRHELVTQGALKLGTTGLNFAPQNHSVNVKDFGARGDGVTDDTVALQAALSLFSGTNVSGRLFIPQGTYLISNASQTGTPTLTFASSTKTITRSAGSGSWVTDKFMAGQRITVTGSTFNNNPSNPYNVTVVTETVLTVNEALTNETFVNAPAGSVSSLESLIYQGNSGRSLVMEAESLDSITTAAIKWNGATGGIMFRILGGKNVSWHYITLNGNRSAGAASAAKYCLSIAYDEVRGVGSSSNRYDRCIFRDAAGVGSACVALGKDAVATLQVDNIVWKECQFHAHSTSQDCENGVLALQGGNVEHFSFINCIASYSDYGWNFAKGNAMVAFFGCTGAEHRLATWRLTSAIATIIACSVESSKAAYWIDDGEGVGSGFSSIRVLGCRLQGRAPNVSGTYADVMIRAAGHIELKNNSMWNDRASAFAGGGLTFTFLAAGDTISRSDGKSWITEGFVAGMLVRVTDTSTSNVTGTLATVTADLLTFGADLLSVNETSSTAQITSTPWPIVMAISNPRSTTSAQGGGILSEGNEFRRYPGQSSKRFVDSAGNDLESSTYGAYYRFDVRSHGDYGGIAGGTPEFFHLPPHEGVPGAGILYGPINRSFGTGITWQEVGRVTRVTVNHTAFVGLGGASGTVTLGRWKKGHRIVGVYLDTTTAWASSAAPNSISAKAGLSSGAADLIVSHDVKDAPALARSGITLDATVTANESNDFGVTITVSSGTLSQLTAGVSTLIVITDYVGFEQGTATAASQKTVGYPASLAAGAFLFDASETSPTIRQTQSTTGAGTAMLIETQKGLTPGTNLAGTLTIDLGDAVSNTSASLNLKRGTGGNFLSIAYSSSVSVISTTTAAGLQMQGPGVTALATGAGAINLTAGANFIFNARSASGTPDWYWYGNSTLVRTDLLPPAGACSQTYVAGVTSVTQTQADNTTNSATAATHTYRAPNATGTSATGGSVSIESGSGTLANGYVRLKVNNTVVFEANSAPQTYTVANASTDRALNVTGDTVAQVAAVLGTLIADLQARKIIV